MFFLYADAKLQFEMICMFQPVNLSHLEASVTEMQSRFPLVAKTSAPSVIRVPDIDAGKDLCVGF